MGKQTGIGNKELDILFPFHFWMDKEMNIQSVGAGLIKLFPNVPQGHFSKHFRFKRPSFGIRAEYESILEYTNQVIILENIQNEGTALIRGQVLSSNGRLLFVGSPWMTAVSDLEKYSLLVTDFAIHDPVTDMLQVLKVHQMGMNDIQVQRDELIRKNKQISDIARFPHENPNAIFRVSTKGIIFYANKKSQPILQFWNLKEGRKVPDSVALAMESTIKNNSQSEYEMPIGERIFLVTLVPFLADGYINIYAQDITEKRRAEERLREREELFKQLVEDASDIIYRTDRKGNFTYTNPIANRILRNGKNDMLGMHYTELVRPDWREKAGAFYQKQLDDDVALSYFEFPALDSNGDQIWIGQNVKVLKENDQRVGFQAVARDITEIKEMERSLMEAKEKAEESLSFKERFLANMSHEIRTPMNGILGMSKLLSTAALPPKYERYLQAIQSSAKNLLVIINDILDLSKVEAGKLELEHIGFKPAELISNVIDGVDYLAAEKDLFISWDVKPILSQQVLLGDPVRLTQVLTNLLSNAIKFTEKGEIQVSCSLLSAGDGQVKIRFAVKDTGIGIPRDKLESIFEDFKQVDASTTRKYGGTGLGLSISKLLVELHGGHIQVESEVGRGSTFFFDLELEKGNEEDLPDSHPSSLSSYDIRDSKVLLVEDHNVNQVYATSILEDAKAYVTLAENGKEAIEKLQNDAYDVVLMDSQMPVMGGLEATRIIRDELKLKVPIIALTANALKGDRDSYLRLGMNDYLSKPFRDIELISKIGKLLGRDKVVSSGELATKAPEIQKETAETGPKQPLYNLQKLESMSRGKQAFVDRMVGMFIQEVPKSVELLKAQQIEMDLDVIYGIAHKLGPSVKMLDIQLIIESLDRLEEYAGAKSHAEAIPGLMQEVITHCELVIAQLKERAIQ